MKKLAIIGSKDLAQQMAHHVKADNKFQVVGFFDDFEIKGTRKYGIPVLGKIDEIQNFFEAKTFDELIIGIGYKYLSFREELFQRFSDTIPFASFVHSSTFLDSSSRLGKGSFIYPGCNIDMYTTIGDNVLMYNDCVLAHNSILGSHSVLSPSVKIAGFVEVGKRVNFGIGTVIIDNLKVADDVRTGASATIVSDIDKPGLYFGCPAKFIKE
ncbi:MAG: acetyltransferase [Chitinophagales bacterium]|nr:acetyltransferase [Chitinophagales bacterium]